MGKKLTPEARRDAAIARITDAGGIILGTVPLAHPDRLHLVAAYRVDAGAPDEGVLAVLESVRAETEVDAGGLVEWQAEEVAS